MSDQVEYDPEFGPIGRPLLKRRLRVVEFLALLGILGVVTVLLIIPVRPAHIASPRAECAFKLRKITLALGQYRQRHGAFPPAYTTDRAGRPLHSWRALILPYLDEIELYNSIDFSKPWDDPANAKALNEMPSAYRCPTLSKPKASTRFLANAASNGLLMPGKPRRLAEVTDRPGATLAVIEVDERHSVPWMAPIDADESLILGLGPDSKLAHPGGLNAAFVDGAIRFLKATTSAETRRALISIAGKEALSTDQY